ncbi:hypothetical protein Tco_1503000 [Tanacetum coccineum]
MMNEMIRNKLEVATMQYLNEVNEIHAEKIARNANPLALVVPAQHYPDNHYQAPKSYKNYAPSSKPTPSTRSYATNKNKGKEIAKPVTPPSEPTFEEEEEDMQETKTGKRYAYHKEKMMLCKQEEKGVPLSAEQGDWRDGTDEEPDEQELEVHYKHGKDSGLNCRFRTYLDVKQLEQEHANQNAKEYEDECVVIANLIANLRLNHDENKKIQKQLKKANAADVLSVPGQDGVRVDKNGRPRIKGTSSSSEAQISLIMFDFSSCLLANSTINLVSDSSRLGLRSGYEEFPLFRWYNPGPDALYCPPG